MLSIQREQRSVHFSGIGGTAMVAGARLALEAGWTVRGSDNALYPPASEMVRALGVPVAEGYRPENLDWKPALVIVGNVLSRGNPEVEAVLERRLPYCSLPEWLKTEVLRKRRPIALCGTHGKTTTTALTAHVLDACGLEPGYFIGGQVSGFPHSARLGAEGAPFAIEGDEYDTAFFDKRSKFFHYLPEIAVVTSLEFDHGDIFDDLAAIERAFQLMLRQIPRTGWLLACADNHAASLCAHAFGHTATYGFAPQADWRAEVLDSDAGGTRFAVYLDGVRAAEARVPLSGRHNIQNALAALAAAVLSGADLSTAAASLASFAGVRRRMEVFLEARGATFVDDFAHHPTAIAETLRGARDRWPDARLWAVFEPRSNTTVTQRFAEPLADALSGADRVCIGPVHRSDRLAPGTALDREALAAVLKGRGVPASAPGDVAAIVSEIAAEVAPGDVVLLMSNGAFSGIYATLSSRLSDAPGAAS